MVYGNIRGGLLPVSCPYTNIDVILQGKDSRTEKKTPLPQSGSRRNKKAPGSVCRTAGIAIPGAKKVSGAHRRKNAVCADTETLFRMMPYGGGILPGIERPGLSGSDRPIYSALPGVRLKKTLPFARWPVTEIR